MYKSTQVIRCNTMIRHPILRLLCVLAPLLLGTITCMAADKDIKRTQDHSAPVILILGDSLSAATGMKVELGWAHLLGQQLSAQGYHYQIVNASHNGLPTPGGLAQLPTLLEQHKPRLLLIELGANDGLRGFPINEIQKNLAAMIELGKKSGATVLLIGVQIPLNYGPQYTTQFEKIFVNVSGTNRITLVPSLLGNVPLNPDLMQEDGLHPNAKAQPVLLNNVLPHLLPLLKK